jgi:hypothetical protein
MEFSVAFLNCKRLFQVAQHTKDGPQNEIELRKKVSDLAAAIRRCFFPDLPDMIGLCELADTDLAKDIFDEVGPGKYSAIWQSPPPSGNNNDPQTGLSLGYDAEVFSLERQAEAEMTPGERGRYHWLAAHVRLRKAGANFPTFWVVVNHWPSDYGRGLFRGIWPRTLTARCLAEFLENIAFNHSMAALLMGDFNCEPFDPPLTGSLLSGTRIMSVREHQRALNPRAQLPYFYNLMWRSLGEIHPLENRTLGGSGRPPGTYTGDNAVQDSAEWRCYDQFLVNARLMMDGPATVLENSLVISQVDPSASDHCAIGVKFAYNAP